MGTVGCRWPLGLGLVCAVAAAALLVASAGADFPITYGVSVSKGCESPTKVGEHFFCAYTLSNTFSTSKETVVVTTTTDDANRHVNNGTMENAGTNILPELSITIGKTADAAPGSQGSCDAAAGDGIAIPYTGVLTCTLPFGWFIASADFDLGVVTDADVVATDNPDDHHMLTDHVTFIWHSLCDIHFDTCNTEDNEGQAPSATRVVAVPNL